MGQLINNTRIARGAALGAALIAAALLASCSPMRSSNGYVPDAELVQKVRPGVHDKESIAELLGSPTSIAQFEPEVWYYVKRESERLAFFEENVTEQKVVAVKVNEAGIVSDIQQYGLEDGREIELVERVTPTRGKELTFLEQLFGNIGRFSNAGTSSR